MMAWEEVTKGKSNPLVEILSNDKRVLKYIEKEQIANFFNPRDHIGIAKERTKKFLKKDE